MTTTAVLVNAGAALVVLALGLLCARLIYRIFTEGGS